MKTIASELPATDIPLQSPVPLHAPDKEVGAYLLHIKYGGSSGETEPPFGGSKVPV
jgi:hypothetical protein